MATLLESAWLPAGGGTVKIDAGELPSGVYFVRMQTPAGVVARKIAVIR